MLECNCICLKATCSVPTYFMVGTSCSALPTYKKINTIKICRPYNSTGNIIMIELKLSNCTHSVT